MFIKKLLPILILIPLAAGSIFQPGSASHTQKWSAGHFLQPTGTITVCAGPPACDHTTIQAAINAALPDDIIQLSSETYQESITIHKSLSILGEGLGSTIIQAAGDQGEAASRVITITNGVSVTLDGITIQYGVASGSGTDAYGGGIFNQGTLTLQNSLVADNNADYGGGIANGAGTGPATTIISNSTILDNEGVHSGAGIHNEASQNSATSVVTVTQSTISENSGDTNGGGIANIAENGGVARFSSFNSTFSDNSVDNSGGGLFNEVTNSGSAIAIIHQSTFSNNSGGNIYNAGGNVSISQSIAADAPGANHDCENIGDGSVVNDGFNIVEDGTCGFPTGGDPALGNLTDNGGGTQTRALLTESSALDAVPPAQCGSSIDQRNIPRPFGAGCDIGAFELDTIDLELDQSVNTQNVIPGQIITFTLQVNPIGPGISSGVISATVPEELSIQWPIQLDPPDAGTIGEPPVLAHSIIITANHRLTMTMVTEVSLGLPGGTEIENIISFFSTEIITPVITTVQIYVNNASPTAVDDNGAAYETDSDTIFITGNVLDNDSDPNGDALIISTLNISNLKGSVTPLGIEPGKLWGNGTFSYAPDGQFDDLLPGETAEDRFSYKISDGQGGRSSIATVTITIYQGSTFIYLPLIIKGN